MVWIETPTNPLLKLVDIQGAAEVVHQHEVHLLTNGNRLLQDIKGLGQSNNLLLPFHSNKWPRQNFSLQHQYNIKQAGDENREEYQSWDY